MDERVLGAGRVGLPRGLVVGRLLERQRAGELSTRHVVAVAETVGVSERTVWRWLEQANVTGRVEPGVRQGYAVSDEVLELLEADGYDHVLVDCRPALEVDTDNVLLWATDVLIPVDVDQFSIEALELLLGQVATLVRETRIEPPHCRGLVINRIDRPFSAFHQKVFDALHQLPLPVVGEIPLRTAVAEAKNKGQTISQYDPRADVARMFHALAVTAGYLPETDA
ncbi:ParA family protein [Actinacidiphila epipremni]|uniref:ParA family protein n=1 Tax=Actinacidiphila epipremni TaxID=2053013 RepID=UPI001F0E964F|nr:ParA family protein [Actinacidiphila epipremni]